MKKFEKIVGKFTKNGKINENRQTRRRFWGNFNAGTIRELSLAWKPTGGSGFKKIWTFRRNLGKNVFWALFSVFFCVDLFFLNRNSNLLKKWDCFESWPETDSSIRVEQTVRFPSRIFDARRLWRKKKHSLCTQQRCVENWNPFFSVMPRDT